METKTEQQFNVGAARVQIDTNDHGCHVYVRFVGPDGRRSKIITLSMPSNPVTCAAYVFTHSGTLRVDFMDE